MTWLRMDDKFPRHPKVAALTDREFRVHVRLLCWCSEYGTEGNIPAGAYNDVAGLTRAMGRRFYELGLWDEVDGHMVIHDFAEYRPKDPSNADRQRAWRERNGKRNGPRNGGVTENETEKVTDSHTCARVPVPVPEVQESPNGLLSHQECDDPIDEAAIQRIHSHWLTTTGRDHRRYRAVSPERRRKIRSRMREFTVDDLLRALDAVVADDWADRGKFTDLTVLFRSREKVEQWLERADNPAGRKNGAAVIDAQLARAKEREAAARERWEARA